MLSYTILNDEKYTPNHAQNSQPNSHQNMASQNTQPPQAPPEVNEQKIQFSRLYKQMSDLKYDMIMKEKYFTRIMINLSDFFETMEKNKWWIDKPYFNILKKDVMIFVEQVNNYICEHMSGSDNKDLSNIYHYYNSVELVYNHFI